MPARFVSLLWFAWVAIFGAATVHIWQWHLDYFKSPGPQFYRVAVVAIPAIAVLAWIYALARQKFQWRWEPAGLVLVAAAACALYEPRASAVACALAVSCSAAGRFVLKICGVPLAGPLERITVGFGAGAGCLISILVLAGFAGLLYPSVCLILLLLPLAAFPKYCKEILLDVSALNRSWRQSASAAHPLTGIAMWFAFVAIACTLMIALAPSIAFDAVAFHLPSVQYYATHHALAAIPSIDYSYFPQGFEMLWTLGYALAGEAGAQLVSALFFVAFLLLLLRVARACGLDRGTSALGAAFAVTIPFLHWSGSVMKNDMAMSFFELLALYGVLRWVEQANFRWIAAAAFFLAQAFGVKYVALFGGAPLALFLAYAAFREKRRWLAATALAGMFFVFGGFWSLRAYWLTGNPVAPERLGAAVGEGMQRPTLRGKLARYAGLPWMVLFHGQDAFESPLPNPAGILLVALAPLSLTAARKPKTRVQIVCAVFTAMYLLYWGAILDKVRYAIPPFALMAVWLAACARRFYDDHSSAVRVALAGIISYCALIGIMALLIVGINGPQFEYFAGKLDKPGYLRAAMRAYGAAAFLREADRKNEPVFGVDNLARFYSATPSEFGGVLCDKPRACSPARIISGIRQAGARYLILPEGRMAWGPMLEELGRPTRVYSDAYFSVYYLDR